MSTQGRPPTALTAVVMTCGLPASGKTTTAMRLHARLGGGLIRSCDVYRELGISLPEWVERTRGFTANIAEYDRLRDRAYREMSRRLEANLASGVHPVILDAVHGEAAKREAVYATCRAHGADPIILLCRCDDSAEVARRFAARRGRESLPEHEASDLSVFWDIRRRWQDPREDRARGERVTVLTYDTLVDCLAIEGEIFSAAVDLIRATLSPSTLRSAGLRGTASLTRSDVRADP